MWGDLLNDAVGIGEQGVAAMPARPGLVGEVDQHAAAICGVLTASGGTITREILLEYRAGFAEAALEQGWRPVTERYDWHTVRVIAATWLLTRDH